MLYGEQPRPKLGRDLLIWLACFAVAGYFLIACLRMPLAPLLAGGGVALALTLFKHWRRRAG